MRKFNITGKIIPDLHYFVDLTPQIEKLMVLVEEGTYFVINRPRQFGKTTLLNFLARHLQISNNYLPVSISLQIFTQRADIPEGEFYHKVSELIFEDVKYTTTEKSMLEGSTSTINSRDDFFEWLRKSCHNFSKKFVFLIDEIDALPETVVIGFLAGLREMYLDRDRKPAPHSVCLAGVHDIKNLQARYRNESRSIGSASPFNIAVDYDLPPFSLENVRQYYLQHTAETGQQFDENVFHRVHHVTNGHPWLVSVLAKYLAEDIVTDRKQKILPAHAEAAIQKLINSRNPNFESLFNNARKPELFALVIDLLQGRRHRFNIQSDKIDLGVTLGIFAAGNSQLILANHIYAQVLFQHFEEELEASEIKVLIESNHFEKVAGRLDFAMVMDKFQAFMKSKGGSVVKHADFREATAQLLFLGYLDILVNGKGWTFKEVQSGQGRIDVVCCYGQQKEVVELKLWYGARKYHEGLEQLAAYLESENLDNGYLLVFDRRQDATKKYLTSEHLVDGKRIQAWVV
jgi:hypothetical protein